MDWYGPDKATFGDRLVAAREKSNLSQQDLAKRLGVKNSTIKSWENDNSEPRKSAFHAGWFVECIDYVVN